MLFLLLAVLDEPRTPLDDFKAAVREARSVDEKARLALAFGRSTTPDAAAVAELSRLLNPAPGDLRFALPTTSAAVLGRFRGSKEASRALERALPLYVKVPWVQRQLIAALVNVGSEAALPALDALTRGPDLELAVYTVGLLPKLPPDLSLDALLRTWEWIESRRPKASDDAKNGFNRLEAEILKRVQQLSGERYPTMTEMSRWWAKHATAWKARAPRDTPPDALPAALPPPLVFELGFNERSGTAAANSGVASAWIPSAVLTKNRPAWSTDTPPSGGAGSLDWGREPGTGAVDVPGAAEQLRGLDAFSVTGWINVRDMAEGKGGNRVISWLDRDGVEIVQRADGSLQVGVDRRAEESWLRTPPGSLRAIDEAVPNSIFDRWTFFAVVREDEEVRIYLGSRDRDAAPAASGTSKTGKGTRVSSTLSVGNVPPHLRAAWPGRGFRGFIDEIRVFGGALSAADVVKVQGRP